MLFLFRSKKGSPYNIFGVILLVLFVYVGVVLFHDINNSNDAAWLILMKVFIAFMSLVAVPFRYIEETFWWWRYERANPIEKQAMIEKLAIKHAAFDYREGEKEKGLSWSKRRDNKKRYVSSNAQKYVDKFYKKYGDPRVEATQNEEQRVWEEAYRRATPEQKARMQKERDEKNAYDKLSPEDKLRRKQQEEFERKVQSTLNKY